MVINEARDKITKSTCQKKGWHERYFNLCTYKIRSNIWGLGLAIARKKKSFFLNKVKLTIMMRDINWVLDEWKNLNNDERSSLIIFGCAETYR